MSRSSERERARLNAGAATPSRTIASGLTVGAHGVHEIVADSDDAYRIKAGIIGADAVGHTGGQGWQSGITYGDPRDAAVQAERERQLTARGNALIEQENFDAGELAMRREAELLEDAAMSINRAALYGFADRSMNADAAQVWARLTTEQRGMLVATGDVAESDADHLHGVVWPQAERAASEHNAETTRVTGVTQKALTLLRIREERGNPDDAAWHEHQRAVFARARENGIDLSDERLGSMAFEDNFRAAEVVLAEDTRAQAEARFKLDVLNTPTTNVSEGIHVLGANGWQSTVEGGQIHVKPDYERAASRVLGGDGDPNFDRADDIRSGILDAVAPSESREWRAVQEAAGDLFEDAEARIKAKLGEA